MQNWFNTLNAALESEGLVDLWEFGLNVGYGENIRTTPEINGRYHHISVYRSEDGRYERPIHYSAGAVNNNVNRRAGR